MLLISSFGEDAVLLEWIRIDLQQKTYKLVDKITFDNCNNAQLLRDDDILALYYISGVIPASVSHNYDLIYIYIARRRGFASADDIKAQFK